MTQTERRFVAALQEFGELAGYWYGTYVCPRCQEVSGKATWYTNIAIGSPNCGACRTSMKFEKGLWEPEAFKR